MVEDLSRMDSGQNSEKHNSFRIAVDAAFVYICEHHVGQDWAGQPAVQLEGWGIMAGVSQSQENCFCGNAAQMRLIK
jgi:hypothetical protein